MKDYQTIVVMYFSGGADNVPEANAESIVVKALSLDKNCVVQPLEEKRASVTHDLSDLVPQLTGNVGVYIVGHGTETSQTVGNCTAKDLATTVLTLAPQYQLARVSLVSCHSGGNGSTTAPHRFVTEFWKHVEGSVLEVVGYTGSVHMTKMVLNGQPGQSTPTGFFKYRSWSGQEWIVKKGTVKKVVSREHSEGADRRKIYVSAQGTKSRGWTNKE